MTKSEAKVVSAAMAWWKGRRPLEYTNKQHVENATINTTSDNERKLAWACGEHYAEYRKRRREDMMNRETRRIIGLVNTQLRGRK